MTIHVLPDEVASQIAAGEVIERPASVVKELLENALDAHAHQITARIGNAGRGLIEVADDGDGIPSDELVLAVGRHATSKLRTADDLFHITTLGFRGEALASIASVARLSLMTRQPASEVGARVQGEAGRMGKPEQIGGPAGTVVRVEDLFFNVPARLKFLKQDSTERQQIDALVTRYAMAYPDVRMQLFHDGRPVLQTSGNGKRREVLANLYGIDIARQMLEIDFEEEVIRVSGFTSPVALTRSNRRELTFFVNGRWVQEVALNTALLQAYHTLLMVGRFPLAVIFIEIDPEEVDVNVHPAKAEVRFRRQDKVFSAVQRAVRRALLAYSPVPQLPTSSWGGSPAFWQSRATSLEIDPAWEMGAQVPSSGDTAVVQSGGAASPIPITQSGLASGELPLLRLVGQVGATYIIAEGPDGLYLIDQHAAHERVLFEKFMKQRTRQIPSQTLLEAATFQLSPQSAQTLNEQLPILIELGFQVEPFGPSSFRVRAIPAILTNSDPVAAVRVVVEDFEEDETPLQAEIEAKIVARICKRAAVKGGQVLSAEEQKALLRDLETCQSPRTCPHGRPTMIHLSVDLLERQFGRRGSR
ncbi:MAG: DNA mismatch repair endonuclease MutL [Anaerolineaceae bacterium]|nr:DNA mismatch repair endonuclease MutL [Anaerolineaceae bacterium]